MLSGFKRAITWVPKRPPTAAHRGKEERHRVLKPSCQHAPLARRHFACAADTVKSLLATLTGSEVTGEV
jgi:hypothetical protein